MLRPDRRYRSSAPSLAPLPVRVKVADVPASGVPATMPSGTNLLIERRFMKRVGELELELELEQGWEVETFVFQ